MPMTYTNNEICDGIKNSVKKKRENPGTRLREKEKRLVTTFSPFPTTFSNGQLSGLTLQVEVEVKTRTNSKQLKWWKFYVVDRLEIIVKKEKKLLVSSIFFYQNVSKWLFDQVC